VQATAAGAGLALSGIIRDVVDSLVVELVPVVSTNAAGYMAVYAIEIVLLIVTVIVAVPMIRRHSVLGEPRGSAAGDASTAL
jgi:BCD family chlorophyll transporter-like MFS transporter